VHVSVYLSPAKQRRCTWGKWLLENPLYCKPLFCLALALALRGSLFHAATGFALWLDFPMTLNTITGFYEYIISGQQTGTLVKYQITAYDRAGNGITDDNAGQYYTYTVIPEFPSTMILPTLLLATLTATILLKIKRKPKPHFLVSETFLRFYMDFFCY
jgi:hypothetical protein